MRRRKLPLFYGSALQLRKDIGRSQDHEKEGMFTDFSTCDHPEKKVNEGGSFTGPFGRI